MEKKWLYDISGKKINKGVKKKFDNVLVSLLKPAKKSKKLLNIKLWNFRVDDLVFDDGILFDWRSNYKLKYILKLQPIHLLSHGKIKRQKIIFLI